MQISCNTSIPMSTLCAALRSNTLKPIFASLLCACTILLKRACPMSTGMLGRRHARHMQRRGVPSSSARGGSAVAPSGPRELRAARVACASILVLRLSRVLSFTQADQLPNRDHLDRPARLSHLLDPRPLPRAGRVHRRPGASSPYVHEHMYMSICT